MALSNFFASSDQETAKEPVGLQVNLPPAHLSTTHGGMSFLLLNVKHENYEYQFL